MNVTTAAENIAEDFSWFPSFALGLADVLAGFGPALALLVAVYLFFAREKNEKVEGLRQRREIFYSDFISVARSYAWNTLCKRSA